MFTKYKSEIHMWRQISNRGTLISQMRCSSNSHSTSMKHWSLSWTMNRKIRISTGSTAYLEKKKCLKIRGRSHAKKRSLTRRRKTRKTKRKRTKRMMPKNKLSHKKQAKAMPPLRLTNQKRSKKSQRSKFTWLLSCKAGELKRKTDTHVTLQILSWGNVKTKLKNGENP